MLAGLVLALAARAGADPRVVVVASARADYTARKFAEAKPLRETYVFMQGSYFEGATVDRSIERMTFREIIGQVAAHLARQNYRPAREVREADLAIVVHWGTTLAYVTTQQMAGLTSAISDNSRTFGAMADQMRAGLDRSFGNAEDGGAGQIVQLADYAAGLPNDASALLDADRQMQALNQLGAGLQQASNVQLLGYGEALSAESRHAFGSPEEQMLRFDLTTERYFIILKAYELKRAPPAGQPRRAVWTIHLNMRSAGVNFGEALARMSDVAPEFAGRTSGGVRSIKRLDPQGTVELAPLINLGAVK